MEEDFEGGRLVEENFAARLWSLGLTLISVLRFFCFSFTAFSWVTVKSQQKMSLAIPLEYMWGLMKLFRKYLAMLGEVETKMSDPE